MRHFSLALRRPCCSQGAARRLRQPGRSFRQQAARRGSRERLTRAGTSLRAAPDGRLSLPAGSEPAHLTSLPQIVRAQAPGAPGWAGASRILMVPGGCFL